MPSADVVVLGAGSTGENVADIAVRDAEVLEFGLYGWALSRFSGTWVGLKAISETIDRAIGFTAGPQ